MMAAQTSPAAMVDVGLGDLSWQAHPEVWTLIVGIVGIGWFVAKVVQPKAIAAGLGPVSRAHKTWFLAAAGSLWVASDWPIHDVAEEYLYFVHMAQHLFISMLIPGMLIKAMPSWLFDLVIPTNSRAWRWLLQGSKPLVAGLLFNGLTSILHWSRVVQLSFDSGAAHYVMHLAIFASGLLMWMPVIGPVKEWRIAPLTQCVYLFLMSVVPTVPSAWLIFAEDVVYKHYGNADRLWGVGVLSDQQLAGVVMKLVGGFFLWGVIVVIFARWARADGRNNEAERNARGAARFAAAKAKSGIVDAETLTYDDVAGEFAKHDPIHEPTV